MDSCRLRSMQGWLTIDRIDTRSIQVKIPTPYTHGQYVNRFYVAPI